MNEDCIFCKIATGEIPSSKVFEDENTIAFLDINPSTKGHILVVPKEHFRNLIDIPEDVMCHLIKVVKKISTKAMSAFGADGFNVGINNESAAGQVIFHAHIHVMPRYNNDGLKLWPGKKAEQTELADLAAKIKEKF